MKVANKTEKFKYIKKEIVLSQKYLILKRQKEGDLHIISILMQIYLMQKNLLTMLLNLFR